MRVLVTEQVPGESTDLVRRLRYLGCVVSTCHDAVGPCDAIAPRGCPLEGHSPIDLVVDVRSGGDELTVREFGVICGARAELPVVLIGNSWQDKPAVPWGLRRSTTAMRMSALLTACVDALRLEKAVRDHVVVDDFGATELAVPPQPGTPRCG